MKILVFNCGSSSIKFKLFDMPSETLLAQGALERVGSEDAQVTIQADSGHMERQLPIPDYPTGFAVIKEGLLDPELSILTHLNEVQACGHRVVHGGEKASRSMLIDDALEAAIEAVFDLAPLHNPPNLTGIQQARAIFGEIPMVACFDTAFHQTLPPVAYRYALPQDLYDSHQIRRYGFHGMSHAYVSQQAADMLGKQPEDLKLITCHLGNGSSMAAIRGGESMDTSMGLTPLEGLVMGTRSGDLDPGILFYLQRKGYGTDDLDRLLNKASGLLGISGTSNDVRDLESRSSHGDPRATLALDIFAYRIRKYIGSYLAVLNGADAIIFTGGIGENGAAMRARILSDMDQLGIQVDPTQNQSLVGKAGPFQQAESAIALLVIPTNEELAIARDTFALSNK